MRRLPAVFLAGTLAAAGAALIVALVTQARPTRLPLAAGGELRVVSVTVSSNQVMSFEPRWKQFARKALPDTWEKPLGPFQGSTNHTPHESLLIGLELRDAAGRPASVRPLRRPMVEFDPGYSAAGDVLFQTRTGRTFVSFHLYPRDRRELNFRLNHHDEEVPITVNNPRPAKAANWQGLSLPQTNRTPHLQIALRPRGSPRPLGASDRFFNQAVLVETKAAAGSPPVGWNRALFSTLDAHGNWTRLQPAIYGRFMDLTLADSPLKVQVQVEEYLSAGFVPAVPTTDWRPLPLNLRARELGFRVAAIVMPGSYRITSDGGLEKLEKPSSSALLAFSGLNETNWTITLSTGSQGILVVTEETVPGIRFKARLRERLKPDGGRVFNHWPASAASNSFRGRPHTAALFTSGGAGIGFPGVISTETELEAELIALHPVTEFFVKPWN